MFLNFSGPIVLTMTVFFQCEAPYALAQAAPCPPSRNTSLINVGNASDLVSNSVTKSSLSLTDDKGNVALGPYKYWGNCFSLKFHRPSCPFARAMNPSRVEFFRFRFQAIAKGEVPCRYCLPPVVTRVSGVLLNLKEKSALKAPDFKPEP